MKPKPIKKLYERIGKLEFQNDQLLAELTYMNSLLKAIGFTHGLQSVKKTAEELIQMEKKI